MEEAQVQSYRDLRVWREAMALARICYRHTKPFPRDEIFGLTSQIRRAAVSVSANIAEGYGRENAGSYVQFLKIAQGSLKELETHVLPAQDVLDQNPDPADVLQQTEVVGKMLRGLIRPLQGPSS